MKDHRLKEDPPTSILPGRIEEVLIKERAELRVLIDNLPDYIYFKDTEHRFINANAATVRIMKCKKLGDIIGKTDFEFYPKEFAKKFFTDEREIFQTGQSKVNIEEPIIDEHGRNRIISTTKLPLKDRLGNIVGLIGIGRDITEQKQAEEVIKRDKKIFEQMVKDRTDELLKVRSEFEKSKRLSDIGTLAASVAHELRNPLGIIQIAIQKLKKDKTLDENKYILNIEKKVWESNKIIDNLLSYSRIKNPSYSKVNVCELLDECISAIQSFFDGSQIAIERVYETGNICNIEADPDQMRQVFMNILNNAFDALAQTEDAKIVLTIHSHDSHEINLTIKDNGPGIDKEDLDKIFIPFFTRKSRGTGLGLPICKELVNLHHGRLEIKSHKGQGTLVNIFLPKIHK